MSSVVVFGFPGQGHVLPSLPILTELVQRGETLYVFLTPPFQHAVEQTGATFHTYGDDFPLASPHTLARFQKRTSNAIQLELESSRWVLEHLLDKVRALKPDYIIHDSLAAWGWYAAHALAKPSIVLFPTFAYDADRVTAGQSIPLRARVRGVLGELYQARSRGLANKLRDAYGIAPPGKLIQLLRSRGTVNLVFTSREFQPDAAAFDPAHFKFIGPPVTPRPDTTNFPFEQLDSRPLVLVSLGTAFNRHPEFFAACGRAFANSPWQVVMAVGDNLVQEPPANFIVRPFVPQLELLKRAAVFVSHGGFNSVNEALYYDVPLVMIPQGGDHAWVAWRVVELGAGIRLDKREASAERLRGAVEQVLAKSEYKRAAARLGASLRAAGGVREGVDEILEKFKVSKN